MPKLIILGSASAVPSETQENTHLALVGNSRRVLIDTAHNPIVRLGQAGLDPLALTDLVMTHFHPDHATGAASLLMNSWLLGRKEPLPVYGLSYTLDRMEQVMDLYDWDTWPGMFPVKLARIPAEELAPVLESEELRIFASPVQHLIPTIGLRVEFPQTGRSLAYSCDTEPSPVVVRLAKGADVLIHEATGQGKGHTSAAQAGEIARQAGVGQLYLIHYHLGERQPQELIREAQETFQGPVELATDLMEIEF